MLLLCASRRYADDQFASVLLAIKKDKDRKSHSAKVATIMNGTKNFQIRWKSQTW